jgi:hypothetical protein
MAGRAVAFGPVLHSDEMGHECDVGDIEQWFLDQEKIGLVHLDQDTGRPIFRLTDALEQFPDQGGMEHPILSFLIPAIRERCLTRGRRALVDLTVKPVCVGLIHPRYLMD